MLVDAINVLVSGLTGMTIPPSIIRTYSSTTPSSSVGFVLVAVASDQGAVPGAKTVSDKHYGVMTWVQGFANNRLHFKARRSERFLSNRKDGPPPRRVLGNTADTSQPSHLASVPEHYCLEGSLPQRCDCLRGLAAVSCVNHARTICACRSDRGNPASEYRYGGPPDLCAYLHSRFIRRTGSRLCFAEARSVRCWSQHPSDESRAVGLHLTCKEVAFAYPHSPPLVEHVTVEAASGEKLAVVVQSSTPKSTLAFVLAVRYNNVDLRDVTIDYVNGARGLMLDSQPTLFEGTLAENVTLGRASIGFEDLQWAIRFVELKDEIDRMPHGLETRLEAGGTRATKSRAFVF